jgi:hypothetical protein
MAVVHLQLDIDSDVHPELYARLASMERQGARAEKLRQLAATGLIWEIIRLHGPAFAEPARAQRAEPPAPAPHAGPPVAARDTAPVDAGAVADHAPHVPENVPVLFDVVDEAEVDDVVVPAQAVAEPPAPLAGPPAATTEAMPAEPEAPTTMREAMPAGPEATPPTLEAAPAPEAMPVLQEASPAMPPPAAAMPASMPEATPSAAPEPVAANVVPLPPPLPAAPVGTGPLPWLDTPSHKSRSARIKRMKESGLFQNG